MDREIKFRAWDIESEKWVSPPEDGEYIWEIYPDKIQILAETPTDRIVGGEHEQKDYWLPIDAIIMQYTGLKDRNGKEIFEGDILYWHNKTDEPDSKIDPVTFKNGSFVCGFDHLNDLDLDSMEVIGNVHENPELL